LHPRIILTWQGDDTIFAAEFAGGFVVHRGTSFWSRDGSIELWLYLLAQRVRQLDSPPEWLRPAAEEEAQVD
jgi:hypothetical protein